MPTAKCRPQSDCECDLSAFRHAGLAILPRLLNAREISGLIAESARLWKIYAKDGQRNLRLGTRTDLSGSIVLERLDPVADVSSVFCALNGDSRFLALAERALGEPATVLKEKLTFKWPGTPGFGPHRDQDYNTVRCGVPGREMVTLCVALDRCHAGNGAMEFFPGLRTGELEAPHGEPRDIAEHVLSCADACMPQLNPGDAMLFDAQIPHRSAPNHADHSRRTYMITYAPARYPLARRAYYAARLEERRRGREARVADPLVFR